MTSQRRPRGHASIPGLIGRPGLDEIRSVLDEARRTFPYVVTDFSVEVLVNKFKAHAEHEGDIYVPDYQRALSWRDEQQSYFIESLILRVPIPPLFLYENEGKLEIVDGSQRLRTLDRFVRDELVLSGLEKLDALNGFRFSELPESARLRFMNTPIRTFVLTEDEGGVNRFDMFRRVNTSGKRLTDAEIRKGAFPGPFLNLVVECADDEAFARLTPIGGRDRSGEAAAAGERQELVLRFFAYAERYRQFRHDVSRFLNEYLRNCNRKPERELIEKRAEFDAMVAFASRHLSYGFRRTPKASLTPRVRFEALAVGIHLALKTGRPLQTRDFAWMQSDEFRDLVRTDASNSGPRLIARIEFVRNKLLEG